MIANIIVRKEPLMPCEYYHRLFPIVMHIENLIQLCNDCTKDLKKAIAFAEANYNPWGIL